jgi:hypothetical protein
MDRWAVSLAVAASALTMALTAVALFMDGYRLGSSARATDGAQLDRQNRGSGQGSINRPSAAR